MSALEIGDAVPNISGTNLKVLVGKDEEASTEDQAADVMAVVESGI